VAADDDDVCALRLGGIDHDRPGVAFPDQEQGGDAVLPGILDDPCKCRFALGSDLVDARVEEAARQSEAGGIDDAQQDHARADPRCQLDPGPLGTRGGGAGVGGDEHEPGRRPGVCRSLEGGPVHCLLRPQPLAGMTQV
jgi:hypothetical protein